METQKILNLLGNADSESSSLGQGNYMLSMIKITQTMLKEIKVVQPLSFKSNLCDYSDAYILLTGGNRW